MASRVNSEVNVCRQPSRFAGVGLSGAVGNGVILASLDSGSVRF
jgi:hypothetical protein